MRVLFVDDDVYYWELVEEIFRLEPELKDIDISRLSDGGQLVDYLSRKEKYADIGAYPWPDLVFLDHRMTRLDGTETLERLSDLKVASSLSICLMTSSDQPKLIREALQRGARFCFVKPLELAELTALMIRIITFYQKAARLAPNPDDE